MHIPPIRPNPLHVPRVTNIQRATNEKKNKRHKRKTTSRSFNEKR